MSAPSRRPSYQRVVDNRVLLLGIDGMYRDAMKRFETDRLLHCADVVAGRLKLTEANVPVEGYYFETPQLRKYFRLMRALQEVEDADATEIKTLPEFRLLYEIADSPLYGRPQRVRGDCLMLLPTGRDSLAQALLEAQPESWDVRAIVDAAHRAALEYDDISLVGLAARANDPVALAALRESVVLYAELVTVIGGDEDPPEYVWRVDEDLERAANRFIEIFNKFIPNAIRTAKPDNAGWFYHAYEENEILGRCARIATRMDNGEHYHWAVRLGSSRLPEVDDFWSAEVWTTERYQRERQ